MNQSKKNISKIKNVKFLKLQVYQDGRDGTLEIGEELRHIPFKFRRFYIIDKLNSKEALRGMHAHKKLKQAIFCTKGSFGLELYDGKHRTSVKLKNDGIGIYVGPGVWHIMRNFSKGTQILVLASDVYRESDYIRDFRMFKNFVREKLWKK